MGRGEGLLPGDLVDEHGFAQTMRDLKRVTVATVATSIGTYQIWLWQSKIGNLLPSRSTASNAERTAEYEEKPSGSFGATVPIVRAVVVPHAATANRAKVAA